MKSSKTLNSITYDALFRYFSNQYNIYEIDESYFINNNVLDLEIKFDTIIVICNIFDSKFNEVIPYSRKYIIAVDDHNSSDQIDLSLWRFQTHQFISFSRSVHEKIQVLGFKSAYFQYYPQSEVADAQWMGRMDVMKLSVVNDEHRHKAITKNKSPTYLDIVNNGEFQIIDKEITSGYLKREVGYYDIFIISEYSYDSLMSALYIMAHGKIVICGDFPLFSDYIGHLSSGIIDDGKNFEYHPFLDPQSLRAIGQGAYHRTRRGYQRWLADQMRLLSLIKNDRQRWSGSDRSASFGNRIRRAASNAAYDVAFP